mmetsp:Transcript_9757/g.29558  ORF Transcript_9757/g.29558 Transcript_9757/m.29558 type:complete len:131 (-) Transcript_9757:244-636(-)
MAAELRRTDAKAYFANERTFLHWMSTSVTIGSIAAALSGVAGHAHRNWGDDYTERAVLTRVLSLTMLLVSVLMALWGGYNFQKRAVYLDAKMDGPYDSRALPLLLTIVMVLSMSIVFGGAIMRLNEPAAA